MITHKDTVPSCEILRAAPLQPAGTVFEGRVSGAPDPVIVAKLGDDDDRIARARLALTLRHPAIAQNLAIVDLDDGPALIQARPPGVPLSSLDDAALLHLQASIIDIVDQALAALEHAHGTGVTHGDLTRGDLVIDGNRVQVCRFGFARPSRPPTPRNDLVTLGACLAPLIADDELRALLTSPTTDAGSLRRLLREGQARAAGSLGVTEAGSPGALSRPQASDAFAHTAASSSPSYKSTPQPRITPEGMIGRKLGDFVVEKKLAEGGLGMVFLAVQASLGRKAVIKIPFSRRGGTSDRLLQRFMHEAHLASRLDHPYAAHIYAFAHEPDGLMWIAMELVDGTPLDEYLRVCGPMPPARAVAFIERLAQVLHRAHELSIVHRDIKPSNVMVLQRSGRLLPKLLDFGIARDASASRNRPEAPPALAKTLAPGATTAPTGSLTLRGAVMGSPLYMAPEQWVDASQVGPAADIYSLGVLAYEVLTGHPPFRASSLSEIEAAHALAPVPSLGVQLPRPLDEAIARALAKKSADRFATALDFAAALDAAVGGGTSAAQLPQLDEALRVAMLERGPPTIAEALGAFEAARNAHQAQAALDQVVDAAANWIGVLMLAARSKTGAPAGGDGERVRALVRELGSGALDGRQWLALARELARPFAARPELHPLAELVALVAVDNPLDALLASRQARPRDLDEAQVRRVLGDDVALASQLLSALEPLQHYRVVVERDGQAELWAGVRRGARPTMRVRGDGAVAVAGQPLLVDRDDVPLLRLHPLAQLARPIPGGAEELFVVAGGGPDGARLTAPPHGFELTSSEVIAWLRGELLVEDATSGARAATAERPPYRGLAAFTADDAASFVGREREREQLLNRLRVQSLVAVVGRSGSGKSSFVQAGVIPHLPAGWRPIVFRPGATPLATLRARFVAGPPTLLVVDQFEELFTLCHDAAERQRFAAALAAAADSPATRVVLTLRDDFLIPAEELEALRDRLGPSLMLLAAPGPDDLERIVVEPARRRGYDFDDAELPRRMVREVADQPGGLAMLSFATAQLWERRDRHFKKLQRRAYDAMGGVTGALVGHAEATLGAMTAGERALVRDVFRRLVTAEGTRAVIGKRELIETLGDATRGAGAVEKLIASRLVVASEGSGGGEEIEVAHETLLQAWPRLVEWRREDQEGARLRDQLRDAARQWAERGKPQGLLWRDDALAEYRLWRKRHGGGLSEVERAFADASDAAERRSRRRRRIGASVAFALMGVVSISLWALNRRAERATAETRQRLVESYLAQARTKLLNGRRWEALVNVVAAQKMGASGPAIDVMRTLARDPARALEHRLHANGGRTWTVEYSPDGASLLTTGEDGAALWDAATGDRRHALVGHEGSVRDGAFSPDGGRVATIGFDGTVRVWDAHTGAALQRLDGHATIVRCVAWRGDGNELASADDGGGVRIWNPATGALALSLSTGARTTGCGYGGDRLALSNFRGDVFLVESGRLVKIGSHAGWARSLRFSRDGQRIVTASADHTARVWDVSSRKMVAELRGAAEQVLFAGFSPDGKHVVGGSRDGAARVWDAESGRLERTLAGHNGSVWYAEFDRDGRRIVTGADDGSARVWNADDGLPLAVLEGHDKTVMRARFSPDGRTVATASYDGTVALWSTRAPHVFADVPGWPGFQDDRSGDARNGFTNSHREGTRIWLPQAPDSLVTLAPSAAARTSPTRAITLDASGTRARVWALPSGTLERTIDSERPISALAIDATRAAIADESGRVRVFDRDGALLYGSDGGATLIQLLDGERWLTLADDGTVRLLRAGQLESRVQVARLMPSSMRVSVISPRGDVVALAVNSEVVLVRLQPTPALVHLVGHQAPMVSIQFDGDGKRVVSTSEDGTGAIWDSASGRMLARLTPKAQFLADAAFDASGQLVVAVDGQGGVELFAADGAQLLGTLDGTGQQALQMARLADGTLAVMNPAGGVTRWRIDGDRDPLAVVERELACKAPPGIAAGHCVE